MIDKQHSPSIRVLIDVVGAAAFSASEAFILYGSDPFPSGADCVRGRPPYLKYESERDWRFFENFRIFFGNQFTIFG